MPFYDQPVDTSIFISNFTSDPTLDFGIYAKGYRLAAERLATMLLEAPRFSDYEAYPVVFLYRHALELSLKHIIYSSARLAAFRYIDEIENILHNHHDLDKLAQIVIQSLLLLFPNDEYLLTTMPAIETTCAEFSGLDHNSFCYRYPADKKGQPSTKNDQTVNLTAFATQLSWVLENIDTIQFALTGESYIAEEAMYESIKNALMFQP